MGFARARDSPDYKQIAEMRAANKPRPTRVGRQHMFPVVVDDLSVRRAVCCAGVLDRQRKECDPESGGSLLQRENQLCRAK